MMQGIAVLTRLAEPTTISERNPWFQIHAGDPRAMGLARRHYSRHPRPIMVRQALGPGQNMMLMTQDSRAVFGWLVSQFRDDQEQGVYCAIFRNEGPHLSSDLILWAEEFAGWKWPHIARMFTYVDPLQVRSANPGYCFKVAGWNRNGVSKSGKVLLAKWHEGGALRATW